MKSLTKHFIILKIFHTILAWTIKAYFPDIKEVAQLTVSRSFRIMENILRRRGPEALIRFVSSRRISLVQYLAGGPEAHVTFLFPSALRREIRQGNKTAFRFALSLLTVTRAFRRGGIPDLAPITAPSTSSMELEDNMIKWLKDNRLGSRPWTYETSREYVHFSMKAGPMGPALQTAVADSRSLPESLLSSIRTLAGPSLYNKIMKYREGLDHPDFWNWASTQGVKERRAGWIRGIAVRSDREFKLRPFALLDFWSQEALEPLHKYAFRWLQGFKTDFTFDQLKAREYLKSLTPSNHYHSLDLTSATDRFPMSLQVKLLSLFIGDEKAQAWKDIMIGYPFKLISDGTEIQYGSGQPMGAYSSWAIFTITHHYVVRYAAQDMKYSRYAILGDDIVICDDYVAERYIEIMAGLGVAISKPKTLVSLDTFEFAKRLIHRGEEVSAFPVHAVVSAYKVPTLLVLTLRHEAESRGFYPTLGYTQALGESFYKRFHRKLGVVKYLVRHWNFAAAFPIKGVLYSQESNARRCLQLMGISISCNLSDEVVNNLFTRIIADTYNDKVSESYRKATQAFNNWYMGDEFSLPGWTGERPPRQVLYSLPMIEANQDQTDLFYDSFLQFAGGIISDDINDVKEAMITRLSAGLADPRDLADGSRSRILIGVFGRIIQATRASARQVFDDRERELATSEISEEWAFSHPDEV